MLGLLRNLAMFFRVTIARSPLKTVQVVIILQGNTNNSDTLGSMGGNSLKHVLLMLNYFKQNLLTTAYYL